MTESRPTSRRRRGLARVGTGALAVFLVVVAFLAIQMRRGLDPALGRGRTVAALPPTRRVLVRRIVERRVVVHVISAPEEGDGGSPVVRTRTVLVPVTSAPVAAAPAPAPAPPPVVTKTS